MLRLVIIVLCAVTQLSAQPANLMLSDIQFTPPQYETGCMRHFNDSATTPTPTDLFLLSKFDELMYPERLDYMLRYIHNGYKPVLDIPSTNWLKAHPMINSVNFRDGYELRFRHFFEQPDSVRFIYLQKAELDTSTILGFRNINGLDPEAMVISTPSTIFVFFRGTDDVESNRFAEWKGTDFNFGRCASDSLLNFATMHKGFWKSFLLIKDDLFHVLEEENASSKRIWLSGHSLGGAMAIISGVYLKALGYPVQMVVTLASPRAIGDSRFAVLADQLLCDRIHRFEYYLDPFPILWAPGYDHTGTRHWIDHSYKGNYHIYSNCGERHLARYPMEYRRRPFAEKSVREADRIKRERMDALLTDLTRKMYYHNVQWYNKAFYELVPETVKTELPCLDDSYPFIYYSWSKAR